ncbi:MAG: hypothetical protein WCR52_09035 [Bacteroidota bacterium]
MDKSTLRECLLRTYYYQQEYIDSSYYREHRRDTLVVLYDKTYNINPSDLSRFLREIHQIQLDSSTAQGESVLDGAGFKFSLIGVNCDTLTMITWSPRRNEKYKKEYQVLDAFFKLSQYTIDAKEGFSILGRAKNHFDYDSLQLLKISDAPIEYYMWGRAEGCLENYPELSGFIRNLPDNIPILLDVGDAGCPRCIIKSFADQKNVYIYGSSLLSIKKEIIEQLEKQHIKQDSIEKILPKELSKVFETKDEILHIIK